MSDSVQVQAASESHEAEGQEGNDSENETLQLALAISKALDDDEKQNQQEKVKENTLKKDSQIVSKVRKPIAIEASVCLDALVNALESTLSRGHYKEQHIFDAVQLLMQNYDGAAKDYAKYAHRVDEGQYTRNLICDSQYFTLMLLVWPPLITSPIHDHGGSECWMRVVSAQLEERFYEQPEEAESAIRLRFQQRHRANSVCFINDEQGLHAIHNPNEKEWAVSLHCYVPGYVSCNAYFDEKNAIRGKKACRLTFTSVDGVKVQK